MNKFVFCIDSDGCAMDTMTFKHELFFGPIAVDVFKVEDRNVFLKNWNEINLYSKTRGVNRFIGLIMTLKSIGMQNLDNLQRWIDNTNELSNSSLENEINLVGGEDLKKALLWSIKVNSEIQKSEGKDRPFNGVKKCLEKLEKFGDIIVVSSANRDAVISEWTRHELIGHTKDVFCQDKGKKEDILKKLIDDGISSKNILMIGDSPGDLKAAEATGSLFYPILVGREEDSWIVLRVKIVNLIVENNFESFEQDKYIKLFWKNLNK